MDIEEPGITYDSQMAKKSLIGLVIFLSLFLCFFLFSDPQTVRITLFAFCLFLVIFLVQSPLLFRTFFRFEVIGSEIIFYGFLGRKRRLLDLENLEIITERHHGQMVFSFKGQKRIVLICLKITQKEEDSFYQKLLGISNRKKKLYPSETEIEIKLKRNRF